MKSRLTIHRVLTFQALGLLALAPPTLHAAITKAASGTDLTAGPSWTGNTAPAAGDVATWASTSLGAGLMLNTDSSWLGMSVSGLLSDMDISGAGKLTLLGSGLSLSSVNLAVSTPVAIGATETWTANAGKTISLSGVVSGGSDLTKTGASTLVLSNASNTFSAATFLISDGVVKVTSSGALGSSSLKIDTRTAQLELDGASGNITLSNNFTTSNPYGTIRNSAGNNTINGAISMTSGGGNTKIISDGGSLVVAGAVSALSARNFDLGGTSTGANTFSGTLSGSNTPGLVKSDSGTWTLTANNTYTGTTTVSGGTLQLSGANGATSATPSYTLNGGTLVLDNTTAAGGNNNDRIADAATVTVNGGSLVYKGSDTVSSTESVGAMTAKTNNFVTGNSSVTVTFGGTNAATLTAASLNHSAGNATLLVNGVNLGKDSSSSASVARFILTTAPPLVGTTTDAGTGINAASYNTKIVPYLLGEATPTTGGLGAASGTANTFGTYTVGSGFRPLNPTDEFTQNTITASNNTRITAATTATTTTAINSLVIAGDDLTIADGQALTATSGAVLFASSNAIKPATSTGSLALGTAEGMLTVNQV